MANAEANALPFGHREVSLPLAGPWRRRERAFSGPRDGLDLDAVLEAALDALPRSATRVALVVPDRARQARADLWVPRVLDALGASGRAGSRVPCLFASGTHRPMEEGEMRNLLGPAADRAFPIAHDCDDEALLPLPGAPDVRVHPAALDADALVVIGAMSWHYLAGFGGGRKMLLPGLADRAGATAVHRACLSEQPPGRSPGTRAGVLDDNPMHQAIVTRLGGFPPAVGISSVIGAGGTILDAEGGPLLEHHARLARRFAATRTVSAEPSPRVVVSAGGAPWDLDLVQAHKALDAVAPVTAEGGRVVVLARCEQGAGHPELVTWASAPAEEQLVALLEDFHISKQTAWSLRRWCERFEVGFFSELPARDVEALGATPLADEAHAAAFLGEGPGLLCPRGAALRYLPEELNPRVHLDPH